MCKIDWCKNFTTAFLSTKKKTVPWLSPLDKALHPTDKFVTPKRRWKTSNSAPGIHKTPMKNREFFPYQLVNQISSETRIMPGGESETNQFWEQKFTDFAHDMTELTKSGWILINSLENPLIIKEAIPLGWFPLSVRVQVNGCYHLQGNLTHFSLVCGSLLIIKKQIHCFDTHRQGFHQFFSKTSHIAYLSLSKLGIITVEPEHVEPWLTCTNRWKFLISCKLFHLFWGTISQ